MVGCYSIHLLPLRVAVGEELVAPIPQKSIRLTNEAVLTRAGMAFRVKPLANTPFLARNAFWRSAQGTLVLTFTDDERSGLRMRLRPSATGPNSTGPSSTEMEGMLESFGGAGGSVNAFKVLAARIPCVVPEPDAAPEPPSPPASVPAAAPPLASDPAPL
jgi:hypothetical protein